jgi:hypothetical protein
MACSPDGRFVRNSLGRYYGSLGRQNRAWDLRARKQVAAVSAGGPLEDITFRQDSRTILAVQQWTPHLFRLVEPSDPL